MNWRRAYFDIQTLSLYHAPLYLFRRVSSRLGARWNQRVTKRQIAAINANVESGLDFSQPLDAFLQSKFAALDDFPISGVRKMETAKLLHKAFPQWVDRCFKAANAILQDRVSVLGHELLLEDQVNWQMDYLSGRVWPLDPVSMVPKSFPNDGSDIKFVWELSRFHFAVTLGRAFVLSGDERYANKFWSLFAHWSRSNPPGYGPNWLCTMEVAIRAVNFLWAGALLASSKAIDNLVREIYAKSMLSHGIFIYHNLEYTERIVEGSFQPVNGNHYMADIAGLLHISCAFPECHYAREWRQFATNQLFHELRSQVDDEGVHWEYSPGYHRLVLEMVLSCIILLERQGVSVPDDIRLRTIKMIDFVHHYRKPNGGVPLVRDIDSGRFCILGNDELTNHDHVLALGATHFDLPELYPGTLYEDCLWYLGPSAYEWHKHHTVHAFSPQEESSGETTPVSQLSIALGEEGHAFDAASQIHGTGGPRAPRSTLQTRSPASKLFRQSGFALMRHNSHYLLAVCCPKGMQGYCGHTHNDFLSFELEAYGRTFITDCGSYVYTQSPEWRDRFRSTLSHNTIVVDGQEQNQFSPSRLFDIGSRVRPEVRFWRSNFERDVLEADYTVILQDGVSVRHTRRFVFLKHRGFWLIQDRITGSGRHTIETRFHFAEGLELTPVADRGYRTLCLSGPNLFLIALGTEPLNARIESGWRSSTYASKTEIRVLCFALRVQLPFNQWYILAPTLNEIRHVKHLTPDRDGLRDVLGFRPHRERAESQAKQDVGGSFSPLEI